MATNCSIIYKDGIISEVKAPNGENSLLYKSILNIEPDKEKALRFWGQTYTNKFKSYFGNWEILSEAKAFESSLTGVYKNSFNFDIERVLFEISMQYNSSELEKEGTIATFGRNLINVALKLYPNVKVGEAYNKQIGEVDENLEPKLTFNENNELVFTNSKGQEKSVFNKGSFITTNNDTELELKPATAFYNGQGNPYQFEVSKDGTMIGDVHVVQEGDYLSVYDTMLKVTGENSGTYAYLKIAKYAQDNNLIFRSDRLVDMSEAAQALWNRFLDTDQAVIQGDRYVFIGDPNKVVDNVFYNLDNSSVKYELKAINALNSQKGIDIFEKGKKHGWTLDKILSELHIPKEQKALIQSLNTQDREEIAIALASQYSYTVEINTATTNKKLEDNWAGYVVDGISPYENFEYNGDNFFKRKELDFDGENRYHYYKGTVEIKQREFTEAAKEAEKTRQSIPTQHYSNMTVPGGTNYIENEIATPAIIPSIRGHAQFATSNGIGWFRSDESQQYQNTDIQSIIDNLQKSGQLEINCK